MDMAVEFLSCIQIWFVCLEISFLVEAIDVSNSGSWLSVIHGQTGKYMVRRTRSVSSVFEQLHNCSGACK